ncbi:phospholipase A2 inhibitor and Ly6/PLAUR domain-containing protein-like, partial [Micropterus salmoides]|uniref:phospholipase A2 inhibitor and Ly6/PLAUR domain-containing protein-like n=1 Tax=Micropterus salmoides TaxID=27706 RepID=UPI0018EA3812
LVVCVFFLTINKSFLGFEENLEVLVTRSCVPSSLCTAHDQILSFSTDSWTLNASVHCCNTDGCNNQTLPFPMQANKNDLQCLTCTNDQDTVCNGTVQCVGIQDRCITVNGQVDFNDTFLIRGCASANVCEVLSHLKVRSAFAANFVNISSAPKCCGTSFCNSAWTVRLSICPLLLGLISLIVY